MTEIVFETVRRVLMLIIKKENLTFVSSPVFNRTGERPYICQVIGCNKRFTEYSSLYKHHVVHTHNKPYTCNICNKTYRQTSTLANHKRTAHCDMADVDNLAEGERSAK